MRKIFLALTLALCLTLGAVFPLLTTSTTLSAKAEDSYNFSCSSGEYSEYTKEYILNNPDKFKLLSVGDSLENRAVFIVATAAPGSIGFVSEHNGMFLAGTTKYCGSLKTTDFSSGMFNDWLSESKSTFLGIYNPGNESTVFTSEYAIEFLVSGNFGKITHILNPTSGAAVENAEFYIEIQNDEESDESSSEESSSSDVESSEESSEEISEELKPGESEEEQESEELKPGESEEESKTELVKWFENNLGVTVSSTMALLIVALFAWLIFKK